MYILARRIDQMRTMTSLYTQSLSGHVKSLYQTHARHTLTIPNPADPKVSPSKPGA